MRLRARRHESGPLWTMVCPRGGESVCDSWITSVECGWKWMALIHGAIIEARQEGRRTRGGEGSGGGTSWRLAHHLNRPKRARKEEEEEEWDDDGGEWGEMDGTQLWSEEGNWSRWLVMRVSFSGDKCKCNTWHRWLSSLAPSSLLSFIAPPPPPSLHSTGILFLDSSSVWCRFHAFCTSFFPISFQFLSNLIIFFSFFEDSWMFLLVECVSRFAVKNVWRGFGDFFLFEVFGDVWCFLFLQLGRFLDIFLLVHFWNIVGHFLANFWTICGSFLVIFWPIFWTFFGQI